MGLVSDFLDAIEYLIQKYQKECTAIYSGTVQSVSDKSCSMNVNGNVYNNIAYYGIAPIVGNSYRVFVPFNNMSLAFIIVSSTTTSGSSDVSSVNGKTGDVVLNYADVGALPDTTVIPSKTSQLTNDSGFITIGDVPDAPVVSVNGKTGAVALNANDVGAIADETDPTVPDWAKQPTKPSYTAEEVGALPISTVIPTVPDNVSAFRNDAGYLTEHQDISGKLDASELPTAINTALAQAKASGEFDGADGKSAYQYAVEGGYTGTEAEFSARMAAEIPTVDGTLTQSGQAADAAAVGARLSALSEEIDTITIGKHTDGLVYVFLNGNPIGNGLNLSDASGEQVEENLPVFANVTWDNTSYAIGNNHEHAYNAWAPNCAHYDSAVGKVMFLQCHRASHTGAFSASELIAIDPYNVMEYEVIKTFQPVNSIVPLCFTIFNGIYYIMSKNTVYTSDNHGKTWIETSIPVPLSAAYGLNIIDGVWYVGNDGFTSETDGVYHVSLDNGATWETKSFNLQDYSGELTCSEASFVKWNGKIYASLRRENANGLLVRQNEDGTWKVLTDTLPNVSSDCALSVTKDRLCYAAINRPSVQVEIGTITISDDDTVSIEPFYTKSFSEISASGDFHTPSYVYGPDFQMVTFMTNAVQAKEYNGAVNACIVGYADGVEAVGYDYDVITGHLGSNWSTGPYIGAAPDLSSGVATTVDNAVINYNGTVPTYYPSVDGDIVTFNAAANSACKTGILNNVGQAFMMPIMHALQNENGDWIACLSKKKDGAGAASLRFVAKTYKHTILSKPEIQGGTEFDCAVYKATAGSINTAYLSYPIPANLTKRLSVSG